MKLVHGTNMHSHSYEIVVSLMHALQVGVGKTRKTDISAQLVHN